jgi:hypothetical protein
MTPQTFTLKDIEFVYPSHITARDFDKEVALAYAGSSHRIKSVDVIFDLPDTVYFVELKDPDDPAAQSKAREEFIHGFLNGLKDEIFCGKFMETFRYEWEHGNLNKPVVYFVIIALSSLDSALLLRRNEALSQVRPFKCNCHFKKFLHSWSFHNIKTFNALISDIQVKRLSAVS